MIGGAVIVTVGPSDSDVMSLRWVCVTKNTIAAVAVSANPTEQYLVTSQVIDRSRWRTSVGILQYPSAGVRQHSSSRRLGIRRKVLRC